MIHTLNIDWLSLFCTLTADYVEEDDEKPGTQPKFLFKDERLPEIDGYTYEVAPHGTRQFKRLLTIRIGKEELCELQMIPASEILPPFSAMVKFANRVLYDVQWQYKVMRFIALHQIRVERVSRVDLCADFLGFENYPCHDFITDFLSLRLRRIGRGDGGAYFTHRSVVDKKSKCSTARLQYSGLSFGSHSSDVRTYLYDKTKELSEVHDKPHIRDTWVAAGIVSPDDFKVQWQKETAQGIHTFWANPNPPHVWRLEVSIKGDGIRFKNKQTGQEEEITLNALFNPENVSLYYFTMIRYYFQFIKNREGIRNITREPRINLWGENKPYIERIVPRSVSGGNMAERIAIHKLWQLHQEYRGMDSIENTFAAQNLAIELANATDLRAWFEVKSRQWEDKHYKV